MEGVYIPFDWQKDFAPEYLQEIRYYCLVMTRNYIESHFSDIKKYASVIEDRMDDSYCTLRSVLEDNERNLRLCREYGNPYILIDGAYQVDIEL